LFQLAEQLQRSQGSVKEEKEGEGQVSLDVLLSQFVAAQGNSQPDSAIEDKP